MATSVQTSSFGRLASTCIILPYLILGSGCAAVHNTIRDANAALMDVANLTQFGEAETTDAFYAIEASIFDSCQQVLAIARYPLLGEKTPLFSKLGALWGTPRCRKTVDFAQRELHAGQANLLGYISAPVPLVTTADGVER